MRFTQAMHILKLIIKISAPLKQICNDSKVTEFEMIDTKIPLYCICSNVRID